MTLDVTRLARGLLLAAYAGFFTWLWLSGRASTYVGPRTEWVIVFGSVALTLAAIAYLSTVRARRRGPLPGGRELALLGVFAAPLLFAIMVPAPMLGAFAVEQKRGTGNSIDRLGSDTGKVRLYEVAAAAQNPEWAKDREILPGRQVDIDGFVSRPADQNSLELSRFLAICCAADATPYSIRVLAPNGFPAHEKGTWLRVRGHLEPATADGRGLVVVADSAQEAKAPPNPYS